MSLYAISLCMDDLPDLETAFAFFWENWPDHPDYPEPRPTRAFNNFTKAWDIDSQQALISGLAFLRWHMTKSAQYPGNPPKPYLIRNFYNCDGFGYWEDWDLPTWKAADWNLLYVPT